MARALVRGACLEQAPRFESVEDLRRRREAFLVRRSEVYEVDAGEPLSRIIEASHSLTNFLT